MTTANKNSAGMNIKVGRARSAAERSFDYARNGHRWAELGPYAFPEAAEHAGRDWAEAQGFEVRS